MYKNDYVVLSVVMLAFAVFSSGCDNRAPVASKQSSANFNSITQKNAAAFASQASSIMMSAHSFAGMSDVHLKEALVPGSKNAKATGEVGLGTVVLSKTLTLSNDPQLFLAAQATAVGSSVSLPTATCKSGTMTAQLTDTNQNNKPDTGDEIGFTFNNCNDGMMTMNGQINVKNFTLTGTPALNSPQPWNFAADFEVNNYKNTMGTNTTNATGTMKIVWGVSNTGRETGSMMFTALTMEKGGDTTNFENFKMDIETTKTGTEKQTTMDMSGKIKSSRLGEIVVNKSPTGKPLTTTSSKPHPVAGGMILERVAKDAQSAATIKLDTVENTENVQLVLETTGQSGLQSASVNTTWSAIHAEGAASMPSSSTGTGGTHTTH